MYKNLKKLIIIYYFYLINFIKKYPVKKQYKFSLITLFLFLAFSNLSYSQIGGDNTYNFLDLTNSARIAAMGGNFLAIKDNDVSLGLSNPSLITEKMDNNLAFSFVDYYTDINYGFAMYSKTFEKFGSFIGSMQFIDYGKFTYADATGATYGKFKAGEYACNIGWGRQLDSLFSIGSNLKFIYSDLEDYNSFGIAVDVAASYHNPKNQLTVSFIASNIGRQLKAFHTGNIEPLPFELRLGMSKTLKHIPLKYSILYNHIEKWDLIYNDPNDPSNEIDPFTGEAQSKKGIEKFADNFMRHIVLGSEFMFTKNFSLRLGYNYQRRNELKIRDKVSTVGFSWGFGIKVSKFNINYSRATYHLAGSPNYITITTNLSDFISKK